ncbi:MAG: AbrB/MazE/SpoVT family DNA-binding domain-containing protein [Lentisphaerae bacterium]|nr:AbrB/MazE/SpoVT family DNA-binding domain-containing protein [Lentisphaerota bacterium]OQC11690.1 MAG: SpoVT / AbrB like domain protein [Lentisphaerae bacterium ADurb.Bin082]HOG50923.1 AbrB/MazE/SpoVT family DNA-binding domain-containing protein [Lentisphaeria bacterium]
MAAITAMSSKGQVVLPKKIRTALNLSAGAQFVVFSCDGNILLKPIKAPDISEFAGLLEQAREWAAAEGMSKNDISEAIKAVRKKS